MAQSWKPGDPVPASMPGPPAPPGGARERRYTEKDVAAAQDGEVALVMAGKVLVPAIGEWLVRGGKIVEVTETNLDEPGDDSGSDWAWTVYTKECL